jgi:hypothetical protein
VSSKARKDVYSTYTSTKRANVARAVKTKKGTDRDGRHAMSSDRSDPPAMRTPLDQLERTLIEEYLRGRGYDPLKLSDLPESERRLLLKEASVYASSKLSEVESRSHYVQEIHEKS